MKETPGNVRTDTFVLTVTLSIESGGYLELEADFDEKAEQAMAQPVESLRWAGAHILGPMLASRTFPMKERKALPLDYLDDPRTEEDRRFVLWFVLGAGLLLCLMPLLTYRGPW